MNDLDPAVDISDGPGRFQLNTTLDKMARAIRALQKQQAPITAQSEVVEFTPESDWTSGVTLHGAYVRAQGLMHGWISVYFSGAPGPAATDLKFRMPRRLQADRKALAIVPGAVEFAVVGFAHGFDASGPLDTPLGSVLCEPVDDSSEDLIPYLSTTATEANKVQDTVPLTWAAGDMLMLHFTVPIKGWS